MRHAKASTPAKSRVGAPGEPEQAEEDRGEDDRGAHVAAEHDQSEQHEGDRHERHQHVLPLGQQPLVLLAGEQVGAPQDEGELAELAGLELEGAAEIDPVLVAVDRHPYPRHLDQDHQEDRAHEQRVGQRPVEFDGHPGGRAAAGRRRSRRRGTACGRSRCRASASSSALIMRGGVDHDEAEHGDQHAGAEDQVVRGQRPVPGPSCPLVRPPHPGAPARPGLPAAGPRRSPATRRGGPSGACGGPAPQGEPGRRPGARGQRPGEQGPGEHPADRGGGP